MDLKDKHEDLIVEAQDQILQNLFSEIEDDIDNIRNILNYI